jgi:hypothetical protein
VEAVNEERVSRKLFTGTTVVAPNRSAVKRDGDSVIEFFAIVAWGSSDHVVEMTWPVTDAHQGIHYFTQFCLPFQDINVRDDEFVFLISNSAGERLICVCVVTAARPTKKTALHSDLLVSNRVVPGHRRSLSSGDASSVSLAIPGGPKCFVMVSKFPFVVPVMLHVLRSLACEERDAKCSQEVVHECVNRLLVPVPEIDETLLAVTPKGTIFVVLAHVVFFILFCFVLQNRTRFAVDASRLSGGRGGVCAGALERGGSVRGADRAR